MFDTEEDTALISYLSELAEEMLVRKNGREEIECALPYGDYERLDYVLEILSHFAKGQGQ